MKKYRVDESLLDRLLNHNSMTTREEASRRLRNDREWFRVTNDYPRSNISWHEWQATLSERSFKDDDSDNESLQSCQSMLDGFMLRPESTASDRFCKQAPIRKIICHFIENSSKADSCSRKSPTGTVISQAVFPDEKDPTKATPVLHLKKFKRCSFCHRPKCVCEFNKMSLAHEYKRIVRKAVTNDIVKAQKTLEGHLPKTTGLNYKPPRSPNSPFYEFSNRYQLESNKSTLSTEMQERNCSTPTNSSFANPQKDNRNDPEKSLKSILKKNKPRNTSPKRSIKVLLPYNVNSGYSLPSSYPHQHNRRESRMTSWMSQAERQRTSKATTDCKLNRYI